MLDETWLRRGSVVEGLPLDPNPPVVLCGQSHSNVVPAAAGTTVGQVIASDGEGKIASYAIAWGDPGGLTPYFSISSTGLLTLTRDGEEGFRNRTVSLDIAMVDEAGNSGRNLVEVVVSYSFFCEGGGAWLGYSDLTNGDRVNLCVIDRTAATNPDERLDVFRNPRVLTSCIGPSEFAEGHFRGTTGSSRFGAIRCQYALSQRLAPGSNLTGFLSAGPTLRK
ncbi:MAG: hypothetical protein ACJATT_002788 [Myxococcota bacterium]